MFSFFPKQPIKLIRHRFKNLTIDLPFNWEYVIEEGDQEACFDPKSPSTLRINIIKAAPSDGLTSSESLKILTDNQPFVTTAKEYFLTGPVQNEYVESGKNITIFLWRLINNKHYQKIVAVLSYTVLTAEINSKKEKEIITLIEDSLVSADLKFG